MTSPSWHKSGLWIKISLALFFILMIYSVYALLHFSSISPTQRAIRDKLEREHKGEQQITFALSDPSMAPPEIRALVEQGYRIMINTPQQLPKYVTSKVTCTNCHFAGGNTTGGKNGGLSLAGVAATFPSYISSAKAVVDLPQRINMCFERSLNSKPLPLDSQEMLALVTYFQWISKGFPIYAPVPWIGYEPLKSQHRPDPVRGKAAYIIYCASCHGINGDGGNQIPPLWGPYSYNHGAGMDDENMFASFTFFNMPYENADLTEEQAKDIAAFVMLQPRPDFNPPPKAVP